MKLVRRLASIGGCLLLGALGGAVAAAWVMRSSWQSPIFWAGAQTVVTFAAFLAAAYYAAVARAQLRTAIREQRILHKPIVVVDVERDPDRNPAHRRLVVRNVGPGVALNVITVVEGGPLESNRWPSPLGALAAGGRSYLNADFGPTEMIVLAEGLKTRTARWTITANRVTAEGRVHVSMVDLGADLDEFDWGELLDGFWTEMLRQLKEGDNDGATAEDR